MESQTGKITSNDQNKGNPNNKMFHSLTYYYYMLKVLKYRFCWKYWDSEKWLCTKTVKNSDVLN